MHLTSILHLSGASTLVLGSWKALWKLNVQVSDFDIKSDVFPDETAKPPLLSHCFINKAS